MADASYSDIRGLPYEQPNRKVQYGEYPLQKAEYWSSADLSLNKRNKQEPLLLLIHGGCWLNQFDLQHIRPLAAKFSELGIAVLSIEYRRIGDSGGGFPGTFSDVAAALEYAETLPHDDIFVAGHSAGGHLALWLAATHPSKKLKGAIGLAAISNLNRYSMGSSSCQRATLDLMKGGPEEVPERYAQTSPHLLDLIRPVFLIHGSRDNIVSIEQSKEFCQAKSCELETIQNKGHFDLIDPRQQAVSSTAKIIHQWILDGSLLKTADGSLLETADGSLTGTADGSLTGTADGSLTGTADGS